MGVQKKAAMFYLGFTFARKQHAAQRIELPPHRTL